MSTGRRLRWRLHFRAYFLVVMLNHARARDITIWRETVIAVSFALVAYLAIGITTIKELLPSATCPAVFSGQYVEPYLGPMAYLLGTFWLDYELSDRSWELICRISPT